MPAPTPSLQPGMGNIVYPGGTGFRVWAPHAQAVEVVFYDAPDQDVNTPTFFAAMAAEGNGIWSTDVEAVHPGQLYRFRIRFDGTTHTKIDPFANRVTHSVGKGFVTSRDFAWSDDNFRMPDYNSLVIYELHLGTFNDHPGNDPGTFESAARYLSYLAELGVNCVQLMPPNEFRDRFSWGYNVALPFAVESSYGGLDDFKRFIDVAHSLGIAVVVDFVCNHFGADDLDGCLKEFDGWKGPMDHGIYFYADGRIATDWGPRPDFGRAEVRRYIRDCAMFYLTDCHCDGLRIDSTSNIWGFNNGQGWNPEGFGLLRWLSDERHHFHRYPRHKIFIAEDWHNDGWVTRPTEENGAGMDAEWQGYVHALRHVLEAPYDESRNMADLRGTFYARFNADVFNRVIFTESHDESGNNESLARRIDPGNPDSWFARKRTTLGAAMTLTCPGIPMIWQGQEVHSTTKFSDQVPIDWHSRMENFRGIHDLYRDLCRLRRNWFNNTRGLRGQGANCHVTDNLHKIMAYHRYDVGGPGDDVIVILNFSNRSWPSYRIGLPAGGRWWCRFSSDWSGYQPDFGNEGGLPVTADGIFWNEMGYSAEFALAPYSALIFSQ